MKLLKVSSKKDYESANRIYTGVNLPKEDAQLLSLYCLAEGITKSAYLRELVDNVVQGFREAEPMMIEEVTNRVIELWVKNKGLSFIEFRKEIIQELKARGIGMERTHKIIEQVDEAYEKINTS